MLLIPKSLISSPSCATIERSIVQSIDVDEENRGKPTTAPEAQTSSGQLVKVSFAADKPGLSHFRFHCPGLTEKFDFLRKPRILALISCRNFLPPGDPQEGFLWRLLKLPSC